MLLDTSALLLLYEGVDPLQAIEDLLQGRVEFYTLDAVVKELRSLAERVGSRKGRAARLALQHIVSSGAVKTIETGFAGLADEAIVKFASLHKDFIVVTLDEELRRRLKELGVRVLTWWFGRRRFSAG